MAEPTPTYRILACCTGNTCRSPMLEQFLIKAGFNASSAGISASPGRPASENSVKAMADKGFDLTGHRSVKVDGTKYNLSIVMTERHKQMLARTGVPESRIFVADVADPFGGPLYMYEATRDDLEWTVERLKPYIEKDMAGEPVDFSSVKLE